MPHLVAYRALEHRKSEYLFPNGSKIRLVGLDRKPNGLRGNKLDLVVLDECGYITRLDYLYRFVLIPATTHVPDAKIIMASTQPETPDHDFVKFCDKAEGTGSYVKITIDNNPLLSKQQIDDIAIEYAPNDPVLTREEKIALGRVSTAFRREYLCERVVEEGRAIVPEFLESLHVVSSPVSLAHRYWTRVESLDSGVRDMTAVLFGYYDFARAKLCIEDEFCIRGHEVTTRRIAELTRLKEANLSHYQNVLRIADNDNLILIQDLGTEFNLHFTPTSKDDLAAMVNKVRLWFQSNRIEIHPRCTRLISALKAGIWDKQRKAFDRSEEHGHFDLIASLVYLIRNAPEHTNPVPHFFMQDLSNSIVWGNNRKSSSAETFKRAFFGKEK